MKISALSAFFVAQVAVGDPWWTPLANFGIAGIVIAWFMYRDRRDSDKQDVRHKENLESSKRIEDAFRTNTHSIIIAMGACKNLDTAYTELLQKLDTENGAK